MTTTLWLVLGGVAAALAIWKVTGHSLDRAVKRGIKEERAEPMLQAIAALGASAQPTAFNRVIRQLWDAYERPLAMPLIRALAEEHGQSRIAQYWLQQAQDVEPLLAREHMDSAFLRAHYEPSVAASCGEAG